MSNLAPKSWTPTTVLCLASSRADEKPLSFLADDHEVEILALR